MFNWLTNSKKGFTMVELLVTLLLLSFGFFAIINIFRALYKSADETEERYIKQESVKYVSELLQSSAASIGGATGVEIYNDLSVVPTGNNTTGYTYLYTNPDDGHLYVFDYGATEEEGLRCIFEQTEVFVSFYPIKAFEGSGGKIYEYTTDAAGSYGTTEYPYTNQCGIVCEISAFDSEVEDFADAVDEMIDAAEADANVDSPEHIAGVSLYDRAAKKNLYYTLTVGYHFPNMVEDGLARVNRPDGKGGIAAAASNGVVSSDVRGCVVRFVGDIAIAQDGSSVNPVVNPKCFIATASYGAKSDEVGLLCDFRDSVLLKTRAGTWFVHKYYEISPPIAATIADSAFLRAAVRIALKPFVATAYVIMNPEWLALLAPAAGVVVIAAVRSKKKRKTE